MKKILILSAVLLTAVSLACILINQAKKAKKITMAQTLLQSPPIGLPWVGSLPEVISCSSYFPK